MFTVNVPADFGKKELTWTLTVNGKTRTAYGHLRADWEMTPDGGAAGTRTTKEARDNKPPILAHDGLLTTYRDVTIDVAK